MAIGDRLKEERERLHWTQTQCAEVANASKRSQIGWEQGRSYPDAMVLSAWAERGMDIAYVVSGVLGNTLAQDEKELLTLYRSASLAGKAAAVGALQGVASTSKSTQVFHGGVGQAVKAKTFTQTGARFFVGKEEKKR